MQKIFNGITASPGYAFGKVQILRRPSPFVFERVVKSDQIDAEIDSFYRGRLSYQHQLQRQAALTTEMLTAELLDAHIELLTDDELEKDILAKIRTHCFSAHQAVADVFDEIMSEMASLDDEYARQRADEFRQIKMGLLAAMSGACFHEPCSLVFSETILVGNDLTPADTASLDTTKLAGLISETGGVTSHIAIFSQNLAIPAVLGVHKLLEHLRDGDNLIVDGCDGRVILSPDAETSDTYRKKQAAYVESLQLLEGLRDVPTRTPNGFAMQLLANVGNLHDVELAVKYGAEGIGLFRTEFLLASTETLPNEEQQFRIYRKVAKKMRDKPVTIRTFDIGGDKPVPGIVLPHELNPFLGWRACRIYEFHPELIFPQLRAVLRAARFGDLRVMFPMIISCNETAQMLDLVEQAKQQLTAEHLEFRENVPLGIMIETPAAAIEIDKLLDMVDFCSIGTNDLTQYTLAVDRGNDRIASLYDPMHPAVLKLISHVVEIARQKEKEVSLCGELAGNIDAVPFFVDNQFKKLSMTPAKIPRIKNTIINCVSCSRDTVYGN